MIHYETLTLALPELRLSKSAIQKLPEKAIADYAEFLRTYNGPGISWMQVLLNALPKLRSKPLQSQEEARQFVDELWVNLFALCRYIREGERVFGASSDLGQMMVDTEVPKIAAKDFKLPFPSLFLEFPESWFTFTVPLQDGQIRIPFIGCYVNDLRPYDHVLRLEFVLNPREDKLGYLGFALVSAISLADEEPVRWDQLTEELRRSVSDLPSSDESILFLETVSAVADDMTRFVVNALLYATSADADITEEVARWRRISDELQTASPRRRRNLERGLREIPTRTRRSVMGQAVKIKYGAPRAGDTSDEAREHRKILTRFRVRGHWRNQAYGAGRDLHRLKFIEPYWKGPADMAELLRRKYQLE